MGTNSKIEWCDHTFNPWRGCTKVAPGCKNCYAETMSKRNPSVLGVWGDQGTRVVASESYWRQPLKWARDARRHEWMAMEAPGCYRCARCDKAAYGNLGTQQNNCTHRPRVFCGSLCDVFEDRTELVDPRARLFLTIGCTPELDWLLLTKRPENIERLMRDACEEVADVIGVDRADIPKPHRNVWLGTSVSTQEDFDRNHQRLLDVPAVVHFLSIEPLLGPIDLGDDFWESGSRVDWVIVGGESGSKARVCNEEWIRDIIDQCRAAHVPVFVKQIGSHQFPKGWDWRSRYEHPKGGDPAEWPEDLRVREFPKEQA